MTQARSGVGMVLVACVVWGVAPMYYRLLGDVPSAELMAHRTVWSLVIFGTMLALRGQLPALTGLRRNPEFGRIALAALLIGFNWFAFIWAVQRGHAVEAGLGYYIFPLMAVLIGVVSLGERLSRLQGLAVGLAALAVAVLTWGLGVAPWLALALAASFAAYSRIKRGLVTAAAVSVTAEVALIFPFAIVWLVWLQIMGQAAFGHDLRASLLLPVAGLITAGPLILFSTGAQRVRLSTLGLVQYLNPTLQIGCATLIMGDAFTRWHVLALVLIWMALALYSAESWRQDRAARRAVVSVSTSGTTAK